MCREPHEAENLDSELLRARTEMIEVFKRWADASGEGVTCWRLCDFLHGIQVAVLREE
jgi:hypothetical protein